MTERRASPGSRARRFFEIFAMSCSESCSWRRTVPGSSSPETIASSITSAMSSAFVVSRLMLRRTGSEGLLLPDVPLRALHLDVCLRLEGNGIVDEAPGLPATLLGGAQRVSRSEDRLVGPLQCLVLGDGQSHPLLAV